MNSKPSVICLRTGDRYGDNYVVRLRSMIARWLDIPHHFLCFTDRSIDGIDCRPPPADLPGWWGKLGFFRPDIEIEYPALYLDLDMIVVDDLAPLFDVGEFTTIRQWKQIVSPYTVPAYNTSAMLFARRDTNPRVWTEFTPAVMQHYRGDQDWLASLYPDEATWPDDWFAPMEHCKAGTPVGCRLVVCNVMDNKHAARDCAWVREAWR